MNTTNSTDLSQTVSLYHLPRLSLPKIFEHLISLPGSQGPVIQSIVSSTSSLMVKMLTVVENTPSNLQVLLLKNAKATHIFPEKY